MEYFTDTNFAKYCNQRLYKIRGGEGGTPHVPSPIFIGIRRQINRFQSPTPPNPTPFREQG